MGGYCPTLQLNLRKMYGIFTIYITFLQKVQAALDNPVYDISMKSMELIA